MTRRGIEVPWAGTGALLATLALLGGCRQEREAPARGPRPVEVVELRVSDPTVPLRVPGVVRAWAEEDIGFEVSGQVVFVLLEGTRVRGRWVEGDTVLVEGDVLARLDPADFEAAVDKANADLEVARIKRDRVAPASVAAARAIEAESTINLKRIQQVHERGAASERELTAAETSANVASANASVAEANAVAAAAEVVRAQASLAQASLNLTRTEIRAPFTGEVAERYVTVGGLTSPASRVLRLTMMDPIEIDVQVSAQTSRRIARHDRVRIYPEWYDEPLSGKVQRKSTSADPGTQTFTITIITRNQRISTGRAEDVQAEAVAIPEISIATLEQDGAPGPLFVDEHRVLRRDEKGWHVWAIDGWAIAGDAGDRPERLILRRVDVTPGEARMSFQGIYVFRSLADPGTLQRNQVLATDVPAGTRDGETADLAETRWALRPGDVVAIDLGMEHAGPGFYVPQEAIVVTGEGTGRVFLLDDQTTARAIEVRLGVVIGGVQRVDSPDLDAAPEGSRVISRGAYALTDGEGVSAIGEDRAR